MINIHYNTQQLTEYTWPIDRIHLNNRQFTDEAHVHFEQKATVELIRPQLWKSGSSV